MAARIDDAIRLTTFVLEDEWKQRFRDKCPDQWSFYERAAMARRKLEMAIRRAMVGNARDVGEASAYIAQNACVVLDDWYSAREMVRLFRERDFPPVRVVMGEDDDGR